MSINLMNLTRDSSGRILSNGVPIVLRGGHYHLFKADGKPERCLVKPVPASNPPVEPLPFRQIYAAKVPCQNDPDGNYIFPVEQKYWSPEPWNIFTHMSTTFKCNFLRVWLMNGSAVKQVDGDLKPLDLTPFVLKKDNGMWKWRVYDAVVNGIWNEEYFRKLKAFVTAAENAGVVVQISLFNYYDLTQWNDGADFKAWCRSPWNKDLSINPPGMPNWGEENLVKAGGKFACSTTKTLINDPAEAARKLFFLKSTNSGLWKVQKALVEKTVETLIDRTNVIYEVMNEPHVPDQEVSARFNSKVIGWILGALHGRRRPLISVNASAHDNADDFDVDFWRNSLTTPNPIPHYGEIDAISYHGLTGFREMLHQTVCGKNEQSLPPVNKESIKARYDKHRIKHKAISLIYCTDAVQIKALKHTFKKHLDPQTIYELEVRDGQIFTGFPNSGLDPAGRPYTPAESRKMSDLQNWAYWCFSSGAQKEGTAHFQNHSFNQITFHRINDAFIDAKRAPLNITAVEPTDTDDETMEENTLNNVSLG
jgi:hypothetical protein